MSIMRDFGNKTKKRVLGVFIFNINFMKDFGNKTKKRVLGNKSSLMVIIMKDIGNKIKKKVYLDFKLLMVKLSEHAKTIVCMFLS